MSNGFLITFNAKFETLRSEVFPAGYHKPSEYYFAMQVRIKTLDSFNSDQFGNKDYRLEKITLNISYEDESSSGNAYRFTLVITHPKDDYINNIFD